MNDFWKENYLDGSQSDLRALGHPQRPWQAQPRQVQQVPVVFIKNWHDMLICYFLKTNRFKTVQEWYRVIKRLSDTLSDLVKLNHGEFRKYYIVIFIIKLTYIQFLNINRFRMVPRWSWWSHRKKCVFLNAYI